MKPRNLSKYSFILFGVVLGVILGLYVKKVLPKVIVGMDFQLTKYLYNTPENAVLIILFYFAIQLLVAMIFRKPYKSVQISFGFLVFPIVWALIAEYDYPFFLTSDLWRKIAEYIGTMLAGFIVVLPIWFGIVFFSIIIPYVVGIDTYNMDDGRTLPDSFGYHIDFAKDIDTDFVDMLASRLGFNKQDIRAPTSKHTSKLFYYTKDKLRMGVVLKKSNNKSLDAIFSFYSINNDAVEGCENSEEILDYKAQVNSLLEIRKGNKHDKQIEKIDNIEPSLDDMRQLAKGLGRKKLPSISQIRRTLTEFPKTHPYIFSLVLIVFGGAIVQLVRIWLESIM